MIPQEKKAAVSRCVREAFGVSDFEEISQITKGRTNSLVYRIVVRGKAYLLKIILRAEDPTRHYNCMSVAAEAGLAPRVLYADIEERISITDFVETTPLSRAVALDRMPLVLRELHSTPKFAKAPFNTTCTFLLDQSSMVEGFLQKFRTSGLLPPGDMDRFFAIYGEFVAGYVPGDTDMVSCHNDLFKPDNILFDGERVLLVDWEAAFVNDRYADLVVVANQLVTNEAEESAFLHAYFGAPPSEGQMSRFRLMQRLSHLFYTAAFLQAGTIGGGAVDWTEPIPEWSDCQRRYWSGEFELTSDAAKIEYARVHWARCC